MTDGECHGYRRKARVVGVNHVALEVGDIEEALAFYGRLFEFELRGKSSTSAFIDLATNSSRAGRLVTRRSVPIPVPTFLSDPTATRLFAARRAPTHGGGLCNLIHGTPPGPHPSVQLNRCAVSRRHRLRSAPFAI